jgi:hypothetical protein
MLKRTSPNRGPALKTQAPAVAANESQPEFSQITYKCKSEFGIPGLKSASFYTTVL